MLSIRKLYFSLSLVLTLSVLMPAQNLEYRIKMSFIEKFARFTEWPVNVLSEQFIIAVIGDSPLSGVLDSFAKSYKIKNMPVVVKYVSSSEEIGKCNILYISESEKLNVEKIIAYLKDKPVLTVGETKGYGSKGVHFNFYYTKEKTIHFEVNPVALEKSGLRTDMYLLEFGKRTGG